MSHFVIISSFNKQIVHILAVVDNATIKMSDISLPPDINPLEDIDSELES